MTQPARFDDLPVYRRIQEDLRTAIARSEFAPGALLPSEAELTRRYSTTRATVVHALQGLVFEGLIKRRQGVGTFVANPVVRTRASGNRLGVFEQDGRDSVKPVDYRVLSFGPDPGNALAWENLKIAESEPVYLLRRLRSVAGRPLGLETRYLPALYACRISIEDLENHPIQDIFHNKLAVELTHITNRIMAATATEYEAKELQVAVKSPLLVREHSHFADKQVVLWGKTVYREEYQVQYTTWRDAPAEG